MGRHRRPLSFAVLLGVLGAAVLLLLASHSRPATAAPAQEANAPGAGGISPTPATILLSPDGIGYGTAVATAGDVNADGYSDLLVGNPQANSGSGSVRLYLGTSTGINTTAALTLTGSAGERLGQTVSPAGDVNGDGYGDVLIGAPFFSSQTGRVYLHHGSANGLGASPARTLTGEATLDNFGAALGPAGDVNGDGASDIVIGAYGFSSQAGRAYVYHGHNPNGIGASPALTLTGLAAYQLGRAVSTAGDINGDGFADVLIGADWASLSAGYVFIHHGSGGGLSPTPVLTLTGPANFHGFGIAVATAGDMNGDGYSDVIVGANGSANPNGSAYVFVGSGGGLNASPVISRTGETFGDKYGEFVATAGDLNGDGYNDIIVAATEYTTTSFAGRAYIFHGGASLSATPVLTLTGSNGAAFASGIGTAGDVNGDGFADLVIGARTDFGGRAYVYHGAGGTASAVAATTLTGEDGGSQFGEAVSTAGDVNGDGYADVIVGASLYKSGLGMANVYHGGSGGLSPTPATPLNTELQEQFGAAVSTAGDVNNDGYADVLVGAPGFNSDTGHAYLFLGGGGGVSPTPALTLTGQASGDLFGTSVAAAGDVNGDGYGDVVIGAPGYGANTGRAYLYAGGVAGLSATPTLTLTGEPGTSRFGGSVASAGDVNRDGYTDVVIGAAHHNSYTGRAYVYHGSSNGLGPTPARTLTGQNAGEGFGVSVGSAGDVDGNGYAELIIGADGFQTNTGRAYIYQGSGSGIGAAAVLTLTGETTATRFGLVAVTAGDLNGDGYADVVIGAPYYSDVAGRAYVYHGGGAGLAASPALTLTGASSEQWLGFAAGTAGDVNGDGYADVLVGSLGASSYTGQAEVFAGNGGYNVALTPHVRLASDGGAISYLGEADSQIQFRLAALGRSAFGRSRVALQWEVKPLGALFNGQGLVQGAGWVAAPPGGVALSEAVNAVGFQPVQHWRVRILYKPSDSPYAQHGPWLTHPWNGANEARLRTTRWVMFVPVVRR